MAVPVWPASLPQAMTRDDYSGSFGDGRERAPPEFGPAAIFLRTSAVAEPVRGRIIVDLDGVRGSGKRGFRYFPRINSWKTEVSFAILNPDIPTQVFLEHLSFAGLVAGVGRFRPEKGGSNGRFVVRDYREEALA
jgi:hypothetical protein